MNTDAGHIYNGEVQQRAINHESLNTRLEINQRYQSRDFHRWLHRRLNVVPGEHVLDVGCGTGAQSLRFLEDIGAHGSITALDINNASIEEMLHKARLDTRLQAISADMADLPELIKLRFRQKTYSLAHSSYALYYSPARLDVLRCMADNLFSHGRLAVFTPTKPHGMVEIAARFSAVPDVVFDSLEFGPSFLEPEFRSLFWEVEVHFFQSEMQVTSVEDFMSFYHATTYFSADAESAIEEFARHEIKAKGFVGYSKNGYLIMGRDRK